CTSCCPGTSTYRRRRASPPEPAVVKRITPQCWEDAYIQLTHRQNAIDNRGWVAVRADVVPVPIPKPIHEEAVVVAAPAVVAVLEEEGLMPVHPSGSPGLARRIVMNVGGLVASRVLSRSLVHQRRAGGGFADRLAHDARSHSVGRAFSPAGCDDAPRARGHGRFALSNDPAGAPCCSRFSLGHCSARYCAPDRPRCHNPAGARRNSSAGARGWRLHAALRRLGLRRMPRLTEVG